MILTAFVADKRVDINVLDIQPRNFSEYFEENEKQKIKEKKLKEFMGGQEEDLVLQEQGSQREGPPKDRAS